MAHVRPLDPAAIPDLQTVMERSRAAMGFVPNSFLTMAHVPQLPAAFTMLAGVVFGADLRDAAASQDWPAPADPEHKLAPQLVQLVAYAASLRAGCRYCQAHTSHGAHRLGVPEGKLQDVLGYASNDRFSDAERAALDLAFAAAAVPNEADEAHFQRLREHFSEPQIVQLVAVIALFGFLNRWNDTMATAIEESPRAFAEASLDWQAGKHGA